MRYKVTVPKIVWFASDIDPREVWCKENFKGYRWKRTGWSPITFSFRYEKDAVLFALRWAGREN